METLTSNEKIVVMIAIAFLALLAVRQADRRREQRREQMRARFLELADSLMDEIDGRS